MDAIGHYLQLCNRVSSPCEPRRQRKRAQIAAIVASEINLLTVDIDLTKMHTALMESTSTIIPTERQAAFLVSRWALTRSRNSMWLRQITQRSMDAAPVRSSIQ